MSIGLGDGASCSVRVVKRALGPYLLSIHDLVGARFGRFFDDLLREQAQADSAVLARVEGDSDARVEAVGDQVLKAKRSNSGEWT